MSEARPQTRRHTAPFLVPENEALSVQKREADPQTRRHTAPFLAPQLGGI